MSDLSNYQSAMRVGDADRNQAIDHLGRYFTDGFLDNDEFIQRANQAAEAKTRSELDVLVRDLPASPVARTTSFRQGIRQGLAAGWQATSPAQRFTALSLFSLAVAIGPGVYNASVYHGLAHESASAAVVTVLTIVLGIVVAVITGIMALIEAFD